MSEFTKKALAYRELGIAPMGQSIDMDEWIGKTLNALQALIDERARAVLDEYAGGTDPKVRMRDERDHYREKYFEIQIERDTLKTTLEMRAGYISSLEDARNSWKTEAERLKEKVAGAAKPEPDYSAIERRQDMQGRINLEANLRAQAEAERDALQVRLDANERVSQEAYNSLFADADKAEKECDALKGRVIEREALLADARSEVMRQQTFLAKLEAYAGRLEGAIRKINDSWSNTDGLPCLHDIEAAMGAVSRGPVAIRDVLRKPTDDARTLQEAGAPSESWLRRAAELEGDADIHAGPKEPEPIDCVWCEGCKATLDLRARSDGGHDWTLDPEGVWLCPKCQERETSQ